MIDLNHQTIAADVEHDQTKIIGCSFASKTESIYIKDHGEIKKTFDTLYKNETYVAFHFGVFDFKTFYQNGWELPPLKIHETSFIYPEKLQDLAAKLLNRRRMSFPEAASYGFDSQIFYDYACGDAEDTIAIVDLEIPEGYEKPLDYDLKCQAVQIFGEISTKGIEINVDNAYEQLYNTEAIEEELYSWIKSELGGASNSIISKFLRDFQHPDLEYTEHGRVSSNIYNCKRLAPQNEMVEFIYVWKLMKSFKTKYIKPFIIAGEETGRYYPVFTQCRPAKVQKIPFGIYEHVKNYDVRNALEHLDYNSMFNVEISKVDGLEGFIKLKDHSDVVNYYTNYIWSQK